MFGYNTKGRGISKKEAAVRNYLDILGRHFWHICGASFWFALSNILFFGASYLLFFAYFGGENLVTVASLFLSGKNFALPIAPFLPLMLTGPFTAGFTYVIRNYAKQEHTFLISDFFEQAKKNIKQGLIVSVISYLILYLLLQALIVYNSMFLASGLPVGILYTLFAIVAALLIIMSFYVYPMMVTFRMSLKVLVKNAWTFAIMKLPQNVIIFAFLLFINGGLFYVTVVLWMLPELFLILTVFLLTGFTSYTANYYIWNVLEKHIVRFVTPDRSRERIFTDEAHMPLEEENNADLIDNEF